MPADDRPAHRDLLAHHLPWSLFDGLASGNCTVMTVQLLRQAERSRRLLLLRALADEVSKTPDLCGPLPSPDTAWELLARAQDIAPHAVDMMLAHPYTGSWVGYTTRLLHNQITGVCPIWMHIGHIHALAAAAAIHAGINFETQVPLWNGAAILPTIGMARFTVEIPYSVAGVSSAGGATEVSSATQRIRLTGNLERDVPCWWGTRHLTAHYSQSRLAVRLEDLDPYRGLYEPIPPQRLDTAEVRLWNQLLDEAWALLGRLVPEVTSTMPAGMDSLVPRPAVPFGSWSASTGEAFGSAIVARPADAYDLAAALVHEFQHILLSGLLHLTTLHSDDPRERFYAPWRDDPRPVAGVLHGVYAFFGVARFWRAAAQEDTPARRRALFEFAYWRAATWQALHTLRGDPALTDAGRRFTDGMAKQLGPWQNERLPADITALASAAGRDHYAAWRMRHLRPNPATVTALAKSWLAGGRWPVDQEPVTRQAPTPVPDGAWSPVRMELLRRKLSQPDGDPAWPTGTVVPEATEADSAYVAGHWAAAIRGYLAELASSPDRPASWTGLGLALAASRDNPAAAKALLHCPELVRAVHRHVRDHSDIAPDELAAWIGRYVR